MGSRHHARPGRRRHAGATAHGLARPRHGPLRAHGRAVVRRLPPRGRHRYAVRPRPRLCRSAVRARAGRATVLAPPARRDVRRWAGVGPGARVRLGSERAVAGDVEPRRVPLQRPAGPWTPRTAVGLHRPDPARQPGPVADPSERPPARRAAVLRRPRPPGSGGRVHHRARDHADRGQHAGRRAGDVEPARFGGGGTTSGALPRADPCCPLDGRHRRRRVQRRRRVGHRGAGGRHHHRPGRPPVARCRCGRAAPGAAAHALLRPGALRHPGPGRARD